MTKYQTEQRRLRRKREMEERNRLRKQLFEKALWAGVILIAAIFIYGIRH